MSFSKVALGLRFIIQLRNVLRPVYKSTFNLHNIALRVTAIATNERVLANKAPLDWHHQSVPVSLPYLPPARVMSIIYEVYTLYLYEDRR